MAAPKTKSRISQISLAITPAISWTSQIVKILLKILADQKLLTELTIRASKQINQAL